MKILHIVPSYKPAYVYGGTVESVSRLCEALAQNGIGVMVFTTNANGPENLDVPPGRQQIVDGVPVVYFKRIFRDPFYIAPGLWRQLYRECRQYEVVHIHSWWNMIVLVAAFICKLRGANMLISPHGMFSGYILNNSRKLAKRLIHHTLGRRLLRGTRYHATCKAESEECRQLVPGWQGVVIPNIVWLPPIKPSHYKAPGCTIIFMSRIHPKKGIELLMEAVSRMNDDCRLKIAGAGDERYMRKLEKKAAQLGIAHRVEWLGWQARSDKFATLGQSHLFALTSYNENFGNVVIEALYAGTPVLISGEVGVRDFVEAHNLGWICAPTAESVLQQLQAALKEEAKRKQVAVAGPVLAATYFSESRLLPLYIAAYSEGL